MMPPKRGFEASEFKERTCNAQKLMAKAGLDALLLSTEPDVRYFTGFLTRFWESPTRPWYVVIPADGDPIAVIPSIGLHLMRQTWITDIRSWQSPDYDDDGVSLLASTLIECSGAKARIGVADQMESHLRMPLSDFRKLEQMLSPRQVVGDAAITRRLRMVKSSAEIAKIRTATEIANRAFDRVAEIASIGTPLDAVFRNFQRLCLEEGADWVPYLAGGAGQGGYGDVISPATGTPLEKGDVMMLDTGLIWDGYFCDFDRNFSLGAACTTVQSAHARLIQATHSAFGLIKPGVLISDLFHTMNNVVDPGGNGSDAGRLGHGLGMQLTEGPSIIAQDHTVLQPGMVLTLEPGIALPNGKIMVHEEDIVVTETGAEFLSEPQGAKIRVI